MKSHFTGRGVTYLFPIQVKTFGPVYEGKDLIAQARTGTGKTFSFAIPLIERLQRNQETIKKSRSPKVTVIKGVKALNEEGQRKSNLLVLFFVFVFLGAGIKPRALCMLSSCSPTELYPKT